MLAYNKLKKVCPSARPSAWEQLGSHPTNLHEIWYFNIFRKSVEKTEASILSDEKNGYFD
jgi:hypothetical protein